MFHAIANSPAQSARLVLFEAHFTSSHPQRAPETPPQRRHDRSSVARWPARLHSRRCDTKYCLSRMSDRGRGEVFGALSTENATLNGRRIHDENRDGYCRSQLPFKIYLREALDARVCFVGYGLCCWGVGCISIYPRRMG